MRELNQKDLVMLQNIEKMLKQVQFRALDFEEAMGVSQTYSMLKAFYQEVQTDLLRQANDAKLKAAIAQAKEVTPEKTEALKDQAPVVENTTTKKGKK